MIFLIGFFGLSEFFFFFFGTTGQRVGYKYIIFFFFFYLGFMDQFVNILGKGGQVYKFWDHMLKILFICIQKSNFKKFVWGGGGGHRPPLSKCSSVFDSV